MEPPKRILSEPKMKLVFCQTIYCTDSHHKNTGVGSDELQILGPGLQVRTVNFGGVYTWRIIPVCMWLVRGTLPQLGDLTMLINHLLNGMIPKYEWNRISLCKSWKNPIYDGGYQLLTPIIPSIPWISRTNWPSAYHPSCKALPSVPLTSSWVEPQTWQTKASIMYHIYIHTYT